jgi:hypothetical protein
MPALLGEVTLTRRRSTAPSYVDGRAVAGTTTDTTFQGSLQPMGGKDRQVLPEGLRQRDGRKVYCARGTLRVDDQLTGDVADQVLFGSVTFTVVHVDSDHREIPHDRALLLRAQEGP